MCMCSNYSVQNVFNIQCNSEPSPFCATNITTSCVHVPWVSPRSAATRSEYKAIYWCSRIILYYSNQNRWDIHGWNYSHGYQSESFVYINVPSSQWLNKRQKHKLIYSSGYSYTVKRKTGNAKSWRCTVRNKVIVVVLPLSNMVMFSLLDNIPTAIQLIRVLLPRVKVIAAVKTKATENIFRPAAEIMAVVVLAVNQQESGVLLPKSVFPVQQIAAVKIYCQRILSLSTLKLITHGYQTVFFVLI